VTIDIIIYLNFVIQEWHMPNTCEISMWPILYKRSMYISFLLFKHYRNAPIALLLALSANSATLIIFFATSVVRYVSNVLGNLHYII